MSYVDNFYVRSMSMRQEWVFLLVLDREPIKEVYNQKINKCQGCALKLINLNHTIDICSHYHKIVIYIQILLN